MFEATAACAGTCKAHSMQADTDPRANACNDVKTEQTAGSDQGVESLRKEGPRISCMCYPPSKQLSSSFKAAFKEAVS